MSEDMKEVRLNLTQKEVDRLQQNTFTQVKEVYLQDQKKNRDKEYKRVLLSRKAIDQVGFDMRFLPKKQREKLEKQLSWYVFNHINIEGDAHLK